MKRLLTATAIIEAATGLSLLMKPAQIAQLLFGEAFDARSAVAVAHAGAAALLAISVACWLNRENGRALIVAMIFYNVAVVAVLAHAAVVLAISGVGLLPIMGLHTMLGVWSATALTRGEER